MTRRRLAAVLLGAALLAAGGASAQDPGAPAAGAGAALFRAGRTREAVDRFEEALALDPGNDQAQRNLAVALATLGREELEAGAFDEARGHLERSVALTPGEPAYRLLLAVLFQRRGDLYDARRAVDDALRIAPRFGDARELSGDLFYQEGSLEQARAEWQAALEGGSSHGHGLRMKLERLGRETEAEGRFGRDVSRHFTIQYDGPVPAAVARTALRLLEEAYNRLWREFGRPPQHDVPVILYSRELFDRVTSSPGWVAGTYDGKIRIPVGGLESDEDAERLAPILGHELAHAFVRANVPGRLPLWFEEGLAQHFEGRGRDAVLQEARAGGFNGLDEVSAHLRGGPRVGAAYAAAALAVEEMVRMDGFWLPRRTLELMAEGRPFAAAFRAAAGVELAEFEQRWLAAQR